MTNLKPEENPNGNQTEKEAKKRFYPKGGKKTEPEEDNNFKPADSPQFQTNAVTRLCLLYFLSYGERMR